MASLSTSNLTDLIGAGSDAFSNLYTVNFIKNEQDSDSLKEITYRVDAFTIPEISIGTISINYQNKKINIPVPGETPDRKATISVRLDRDMTLFKKFYNLIATDESGNFITDRLYDDNYKLTIIVKQYKSVEINESNVTCKWIFNDCYLTKIGSSSLGYSNSSALSIPLDFIYKNYTIT